MKILLVDIDSLRPDHLGCYGYDRNTSPTIDAIAERGVRFDRCFVSDAPCLPSRTALATCRHGLNSGVVTHHGEGQNYDEPGDGHDPDADRMLAFRHLAEHGVYTASVSQFSQRHLAHHFSASFQESITPTATAGGPATEDCSDVTPVAQSWLERHADDEDWLLHVNYWDVHHPYLGIEEFVDPVRDSGPAPAWPDQDAIDDQQGMTGVRCADLWPDTSQYGPDWLDFYDWPMPESVTDRDDVEQFVDGYDASIRRVDGEIATLLETLDRNGIREETAVVVTADHGEAFGEHGIYAEHAFPHPACQQVPLIVSWPGVTDDVGGDCDGAGASSDDSDSNGVDTSSDDAGTATIAGSSTDTLVYQFDLVPTICDLADVPIPAGWDAEAFTPALRGDPFEGRDFLVSEQGIYTYGRAVYRGKWLYIRLMHPGVFSSPGLYNDPELPTDGLELLHDLESDPHTTRNLVESNPEKTAELRATLDRWLVSQLSDDWPAQRPVDARGRDPLARTASIGPYLYVDPDDLLELYREHDHLGTDAQIEALERTMKTFPRNASSSR
ncbi:sulfatase [Halobacteria archaeon AArc-m2/3/4]|uniref:Sulfatase n=1 Tax=Natronoglomus mannanivorans TaxID=2979990 RepID=A0ABT2QFW8_9EURY|nr:sulfatase [Halobacteria archaeon AArc-m2/3/4]